MEKLKDIAFFSALGEEEISSLENISSVKKYAPGDIIFTEGGTGKNIYFLLAGTIAIRKKIASGEKTIAILRKGDIFGEMAVFENAPRSATAQAADDCEILEIEGDGFSRFLAEKPKESFGLLMKMIAVSSSRLRNMDRYFTTIYELAKEMGLCSNTGQLAEKAVNKIAGSLNVKGAVLYQFDMYNDEFSPAHFSGSAGKTPSLPSAGSFAEKLKSEKWLTGEFEDLGSGKWFVNIIEHENSAEGFIAVVSDADLSWEDKILIGTICNMIGPVMANLKIKAEEELKGRLGEKKWQL